LYASEQDVYGIVGDQVEFKRGREVEADKPRTERASIQILIECNQQIESMGEDL
jgi:hypothetical protein